MSLLERVIIAHRCRSTHHYIAMDALPLLDGPDAERWRNLILVHNEELLAGAKAPDAVFKDFKNHVLHIEEGEWGGARDAAVQWYGEAVAQLRDKKWDKAIYALGVLSHYYADPIQPFHTGQTEEEGTMHRAVEWSIAKSRDTIKARIEEMGYPEMKAGEGVGFVSDMVRAGAEKSHPHYQTILDHYNLDVGAKNPPAGLDQTLIDVIAELVAYATAGLSVLFSRAFAEAGVAAPRTHISVPGYLATLDIPLRWITKKLDDAGDKRMVERMYREYKETGKVIKTLPDDDREIRKLHARQVLRRPIAELDEQDIKPIGQKYEPRPEYVAFAEEIALALAPESEDEGVVAEAHADEAETAPVEPELVEVERPAPIEEVEVRVAAQTEKVAEIEAGKADAVVAVESVSEAKKPAARRKKRKSKGKKPVIRVTGDIGISDDPAGEEELTGHEAKAFERIEAEEQARLERERVAAEAEAKRKADEAAKLAAEKAAKEEEARLAAERAEKERLEAEEFAKLEAEEEARRLEQERLDAEELARMEAEEEAAKAEAAKKAEEEAMRLKKVREQAQRAEQERRETEALRQAVAEEDVRVEEERLAAQKLADEEAAWASAADDTQSDTEQSDDEFTLEELAAFDTNLTPDGDVVQADAPPVASFFDAPSGGAERGARRASLMPDDPVIDAPSIGKKTARRLNRVGIFTVADLLACDVEEIAFELDVRHIDEPTLEDWKAQATLMIEVAGLRVHDAQILVGAGIRNGEDLANASATRIFHASMGFLKTSEGARVVRDDHILRETEVSEWIDMAKESNAA